jgi:hypothetical protein
MCYRFSLLPTVNLLLACSGEAIFLEFSGQNVTAAIDLMSSSSVSLPHCF